MTSVPPRPPVGSGGRERWIRQVRRAVADGDGCRPARLSALRDLSGHRQRPRTTPIQDERLRLALEATSDGIWEWTIPTNEVYFSPRYFTMLGYEPNEMVPCFRTWRGLLHPDDKHPVAAKVREHLGGKKEGSFELEFRMRTKTGQWRWILGRGAVVQRDAQGKALRMIGTHSDITERKKAEEALKESEHSYRSLAESLPGLVYRVDARENMEMRFLNQTLESLTGYTEQELKAGQAKTPLIFPEDRPQVVAAVQQAIQARQSFEVSYRITTKQGKVRHFSERGQPRFDSDGSLRFVEGVIFDVTARKQGELDLRASEEKYRLLVENQTDMLVKMDGEGGLVFVSPSFCRLFGKSQEEVLKTSILSLVHVDDLPAVRRDLRHLFQPPYSVHLEHRATTKAGSRWLAWMATAVLDENGQVSEIVGVGRDVTARKQTEMTLARSESTLRAILGTSPVGIGLMQSRRLVWFNEAMPRVLGYTGQEIVGRDTRVFFADEAEFLRVERELTQSLSSNQVGAAEARLKRKDGGDVHVQVAMRPMDAADPDSGVIVVLIDITERKLSQDALQKAHDQLEERVAQRTRELEEAIGSLRREIVCRQEMELGIRESEHRYHQLFMEMSAGFALHDIVLDEAGEPVDYRFVQVNPAFEQLTGLKAEDIVGRTVLEVLPKTERHWIEQYGQVAMSGRSVHLERYSRSLDKYFEVAAFCPKRGQFATTFTDISQRKRAERVLRQNEKYLNTLLDTMQAGVAIIDAQSHTISYVNKHAARMIGAPREEIVGRVCHRFICPAQLNRCPVEITPHGIDNSERVLLTADGREVPILKSVSAIQRMGRPHLVESFIDISDLRRLLRERELSISRAKSILGFTNGVMPRHTDLAGEMELVACGVSLPCHQEGGDHLFVRSMPALEGARPARTIFSLKDQSGHKVGCILRSIHTDLFHQAILTLHPEGSLEQTTELLNRKIGEHQILGRRHFITAVNGEIDHQTLRLRYLLCGHPSFLLIRGREVMLLPEPGQSGKNLPLGALRETSFRVGEFQLRPGDRIIAFTDGLLDALESHGKPNSEQDQPGEQLRNIVSDLRRGREDMPVMDVIEGLLAVAARTSGKKIHPAGDNGSEDDITLLGLEILPKSARLERTVVAGDIIQLQEQIDRLLEFFGTAWTQGGFLDLPRLRYALSEALVNAWRHGNGGDPGKIVRVRYSFGSDFFLEVSDQGQGFAHQAVGDPRYGCERLEAHGRGLLLIKRHATTVAHNEQGNSLTMTFDRRPGQRSSLHGQDMDGHALST